MNIQNHTETTTPMLITKLGQHLIILGKPWMKKHGAILDIKNNRLSFWPRHYQQDVALRPRTAEPYATKLHAKELHAEMPHADVPKNHIKTITNHIARAVILCVS